MGLFCKNCNYNSSEEKYKARYVVQGYSQVKGLNFKEIVSPTAKLTSVRMLMQIGIQDTMLDHHMNVKFAYLQILIVIFFLLSSQKDVPRQAAKVKQ